MRGPRASAALVLVLVLALAPRLPPCLAEAKAPARLSDAGPMSWLIEGEGASIYALGTIHIGAKEPGPIDERSLEAFREADLLMAELGAEDYGRIAQASAMLVADSALPAPESLAGRLSPTCRSAAVGLLGERLYAIAIGYRPWVLASAMINAAIARSGLASDSGVDARLYALAGGRPVEGLDSLEDQLALVAEGTDEEQIAGLEAAAPKFLDGSFIAETRALLDAYDAGDRPEVARLFATSIAEGSSSDPAAAEDFRLILYERNAAWARRLAAALEAGGKYFVFAGAAHFIGPGSVFDEMRALGALE